MHHALLRMLALEYCEMSTHQRHVPLQILKIPGLTLESQLMAVKPIGNFCDNAKCALHIPYRNRYPWASVCRGKSCRSPAAQVPPCSHCLVFGQNPPDRHGRTCCDGCRGDPNSALCVPSGFQETLRT